MRTTESSPNARPRGVVVRRLARMIQAAEGRYEPLSSVDPQAERIGFEAAGLLVRRIAGETADCSPLRILPAGVVTRGSTDTLAVADPDVAAALRYIREHASKPIRVGDVVAASVLSRRTLERRFAEMVGRSPAEEICRQHIERARHHLVFTDWSLTRIAYDSGFRSLRHLGEVFRRELDCSPGVWRKKRRS